MKTCEFVMNNSFMQIEYHFVLVGEKTVFRGEIKFGQTQNREKGTKISVVVVREEVAHFKM